MFERAPIGPVLLKTGIACPGKPLTCGGLLNRVRLLVDAEVVADLSDSRMS